MGANADGSAEGHANASADAHETMDANEDGHGHEHANAGVLHDVRHGPHAVVVVAAAYEKAAQS